MTDLFIGLYLDEDVDVLVATLLRSRGFTVTTTLEEGRLGRSDAEQLEHAVDLRRTFLTHNRMHFEALAEAWRAAGRTHFGIILAARRPPHDLVQRLLVILNTVAADEIVDQVRYI